jgi:hypothetical protein
MKKFQMALLFTTLTPTLAFAFFCPTNFNQIDFGMTVDQVVMACGNPDSQKDYVKPNDDIPQEWTYFVPQTVNMGGSGQNAQGTLKTSVSFDDKGKAVNISVNGIGVGASSICGGANIQLGADKDTIRHACGDPAYINKQTPAANPGMVENWKITEFTYSSATPPVTLVFENGRLADKR